MKLPRRLNSHWQLGDNFFTYDQKYDGGGISFSPFLLSYIKQLQHPFASCIEVCAGLGFMGLSLLENSLIDNLTLSDINEDIISLVTHRPYIHSDLLDTVSGTFDLIIANLPYFASKEAFLNEGVQNKHIVDSKIYLDKDWNLHKKLFRQADLSLNKNGLLIFFGEKSQLVSTNYFEQYTKQYKTKDIVDTWINRKMIILEKT